VNAVCLLVSSVFQGWCEAPAAERAGRRYRAVDDGAGGGTVHGLARYEK
jgi:hypothetical protein